MSIENLAGGATPKPEHNTPAAADLINRAQSGDVDALIQLINIGKPLFVQDMPGKLAEFNAGKAEGAKGGEGK